MTDAASQLRARAARWVGWLTLLAVLWLPALHALHLRLGGDGDEGERPAAVAVVPADPAPSPPQPHDASHCAVCVAFESAHAGAARFDGAVAVLFDAPAAFAPPRYLPPAIDAFAPIVAVPRGPPVA